MKIGWPWPDRLGNQIALLLAIALLLEFGVSEWLLQRYERQRIAEQHVDDLLPDLVRAHQLVQSVPAAERAERLQWLGSASLSFRWHDAAPVHNVTAGAARKQMLLTAEQQTKLRGLRHFYMARTQRDIVGRWQLPDDSWVEFSGRLPQFYALTTVRHIGSLIIFIVILNLVLLLVARQISRPLQILADHADDIGRAAETPICESGSYEMRQVARAYNELQARMNAEVDDRLQSLAAVSHDLRTPIARMNLRVGQVADHILRGHMENDLAEMNAFIDALLDYLSGQDPEAEQLINVGSLLATIADGEQDVGHDVHYHGSSLLECATRPVKLQRVVSNLVQNAVRHAGSADIYADLQADALHIWIDDHGPGIAPDQLERVFEPFTRLESSRNRATGGAGLGLAIVKRSAARLNGRIILSNRPEGGLRASLWLPR